MTHVIIIVGRASTISAQLAAIQSLGLVPSGPKIINSEGGPTSRQHEQHCLTFTDGGASPQAPAVDPLPR